jgi:hypothetical protein
LNGSITLPLAAADHAPIRVLEHPFARIMEQAAVLAMIPVRRRLDAADAATIYFV